MHEIERKFLLNRPLEDVLAAEHTKTRIDQHYLGQTGEWTVRARRSISGDDVSSYYLTLKRKETDRSSVEIETAVDRSTYESVVVQANRSLSKVRHTLKHSDHVWEIDLFEHGLVLAEIELTSEDETFEIPEWVGTEVTHDKLYRSSQIAKGLTSAS